MLKIILFLLLAAFGVVLVLAARQPDRFRVERSTVIAAPPERVHALVNDFRAWSGWSPWEKRDPALQRRYSGAEQGVGAVYEWTGNSQVGQGRMEIRQSEAPLQVVIQLDFLKPFEAHNTAEFLMQPEAGGTRVLWAMHGPSPFLSKLMQVFFSMDKMVGKDFEAGLANLKALAEQPPAALPAR